MRLGDRIAVFRQGGVLEQYDTPAAVLGAPATPFVADFVGADRGLRRLAVTGIDTADLEKPPVVALDDDLPAARAALAGAGARFALVLDVGERLRGYVAADRLDGDGTVADRVRRLPAAVHADATLKAAMGELLQHDAGWVAVLEPGTDRYLGVLTPALAARRAAPVGRRGVLTGQARRRATSSSRSVTSPRSSRYRARPTSLATSGTVPSTRAYVLAAPGESSWTQNSTTPIWYSHNSSGSAARRSGGTLRPDGALDRLGVQRHGHRPRRSPTPALNGLSGLRGSAAERNRSTAKAFSDCMVSTRLHSTPCSRSAKPVSRSRWGRAAAACRSCDAVVVGLHEMLLAREVVVGVAHRDAGLGRDQPHRRRLVAVLAEQPQRRLDDALARLRPRAATAQAGVQSHASP